MHIYINLVGFPTPATSRLTPPNALCCVPVITPYEYYSIYLLLLVDLYNNPPFQEE